MKKFKDIWPENGPEIGYKAKTKKPTWGAVITGTIIQLYKGYDDLVDGERYFEEPGVAIKIDNLPPEWPYQTNIFCQDLDEIEWWK